MGMVTENNLLKLWYYRAEYSFITPEPYSQLYKRTGGVIGKLKVTGTLLMQAT